MSRTPPPMFASLLMVSPEASITPVIVSWAPSRALSRVLMPPSDIADYTQRESRTTQFLTSPLLRARRHNLWSFAKILPFSLFYPASSFSSLLCPFGVSLSLSLAAPAVRRRQTIDIWQHSSSSPNTAPTVPKRGERAALSSPLSHTTTHHARCSLSFPRRCRLDCFGLALAINRFLLLR